jgi:hypothetical protein
MNTIWGKAQHTKIFAPGIVSVQTASHGGIVLDDEHARKMETTKHIPFCGDYHYWEEDCDWPKPFLTFKAEIRAGLNDDTEFDRIMGFALRYNY